MQTQKPTIADLLAAGDRPLHSFEFMPPRSEDDVYRLWSATDALVPMAPDFISVTYGANGSRRDRTLRCTQHMVSTGLRTVGHLTCVVQSVSDLEQMVADYAESGVNHILAVRGDMPGGAGQPWVAHPEGLPNATELVRLVKRVIRSPPTSTSTRASSSTRPRRGHPSPSPSCSSSPPTTSDSWIGCAQWAVTSRSSRE